MATCKEMYDKRRWPFRDAVRTVYKETQTKPKKSNQAFAYISTEEVQQHFLNPKIKKTSDDHKAIIQEEMAPHVIQMKRREDPGTADW